MVSITQTVGPLFGSRVITPDLGFVYASTMGSYLSIADQAPGSRPRTTIAPTIVTRDGEVVLALGATAVALPRVHPERGQTESGERVAYPEKINLEMTPERGWTPEVGDALRADGFEILPAKEHASFGRVHLVARDGNAWNGVADLDWEGTTASAACGTR